MSITHLVYALLRFSREDDSKTRHRRRSWPLNGLADTFFKTDGKRLHKLQNENVLFPFEILGNRIFHYSKYPVNF
jgi:hypothetical protein